MLDFKKLLIWQKGMALVKECYSSASYFLNEEIFAMRSQVIRSAEAA
jgi:four helix bundle protein